MDYPFDRNPPESLYKYTTACSAVKILMTNKIYFSTPTEFNDPFDALPVLNMKTKEDRKSCMENMENRIKHEGSPPIPDWNNKKHKIINDQKCADNFAIQYTKGIQKLDKTGFCCLSSVNDSLPMWAHYADNHTGCCLIFNFRNYNFNPEKFFPFLLMKKIEYRDDLPKHDMNNLASNPEYVYKFIEWAYEHEWRSVMHDSSIDEFSKNHPIGRKCTGYGLYNLPENILHGVILGCKMKDDYKNVVIEAARYRKTKVYQAIPELYDYGMKIELLK